MGDNFTRSETTTSPLGFLTSRAINGSLQRELCNVEF